MGEDGRAGDGAAEVALDAFEQLVPCLDRPRPGTRTCRETKARRPDCRVWSAWNATPSGVYAVRARSIAACRPVPEPRVHEAVDGASH